MGITKTEAFFLEEVFQDESGDKWTMRAKARSSKEGGRTVWGINLVCEKFTDFNIKYKKTVSGQFTRAKYCEMYCRTSWGNFKNNFKEWQ